MNEAEARARHKQNKIAWDQAATRYSEWFDEQLSLLQTGGDSLHPIERANLGDLARWCDTAIHLQCASGQDTLSLWRRGVKSVIGVDISSIHIENARRMAAALQAPASWYCCDVLDTPSELDGTADLIYTGRGSMNWLHDLDAWARVVARLLKPGGILHLFDDHPVTWLFEENEDQLKYSGNDYFETAEVTQGWSPTYVGDLGLREEEHAEKHERVWPISNVIQAVITHDLVIERFNEHSVEYWNSMPNVDASQRGRIPMTYSLMARRRGS